MDWSKGGGNHRHRLHSPTSSSSLGYIFDNPVAYEEAESAPRRKIDYGNFTSGSDVRGHQHLRIKASPRSEGMGLRHRPRGGGRSSEPVRGMGSYGREVLEEEEEYDPASTVISQPCRRKLCMDDLATTPTDVLLPGSSDSGTSASVTPLLEDCEIYSDISSSAEDPMERRRGRKAYPEYVPPRGCSTPLRDAPRPEDSPSPGTSSDGSSASLRSLEDLDSSVVNGVKLAQTSDRCFSRGGSLRTSVRAAVHDGTYFVYPGWSMWNKEHSYRTLTSSQDTTASSEPSKGGFLGVKSLRTTLYQHLVAAAGQRYHLSTVSRSSSTRTVLSSRSTRRSNSSSRCTCGRAVEEAKLPLLSSSQRTVKKKRRSWEPVTFFRKGLRSLASKGFAHDGFTFPSVIPLPGMGIPKLEHKKLLRSRRKKSLLSIEPSESQAGAVDVTTRATGYGYLQCMIRNGGMSYSFWMDEHGDVLVAKPEQERERCIRFYTCKAERSLRWRSWPQRKGIRRRIVNLVGTMNFSCYVYSELSFKGRVTHYMDSEFSLVDERRSFQAKRPAGAEYLRTLWRRESSEEGVKVRKELSAVVIRAPLEVRKDETRSGKSRVEGVTSSWGSILGSTGESVHVILPTGDHGHPTCGLDGPRPLAERWRSGGLCDCGSWDLGCGMITLSRDSSSEWKENNKQPPLNITLEGTKQRVVAMSLDPCEDGLYRLSFHKPMMALQAFATAVAILHGKLNTGEFSSGLRSDENQTKLPVVLIGSRHPNPPLSPIDRL